jgi:hypothetical protein
LLLLLLLLLLLVVVVVPLLVLPQACGSLLAVPADRVRSQLGT